ncbi:MAG TPA: hypothetical protein VHF22_02795 [Planctomycetota bacterium]|nr:hypothetical protein [Planctomycetota bacterium]
MRRRLTILSAVLVGLAAGVILAPIVVRAATNGWDAWRSSFLSGGGVYSTSAPVLSNGEHNELQLDAAANLKVDIAGTSPKRTYRAVTQTAAPVGDFLELCAGSSTGKILKVFVAKPDTAATISFKIRSTADTGGTFSSLALTKNDGTNAAPGFSCKVYSVPPTPGSSAGDAIPPLAFATADVATFTFGESTGQPLVLRPGQSFAVASDTTLTAVSVAIEETEE